MPLNRQTLPLQAHGALLSATSAQPSRVADLTVKHSVIPKWAPLPTFKRVCEGISTSTIYAALGAGHLRAKKLGNRTLIDMEHALAWIESLPDASVRPRKGRLKQAA